MVQSDKMGRLFRHQSGAMAMVSVILVAIIMTLIITTFIRLTINESRQAIDKDLSSRAFYAAESGVEDAKRAIEMFQNKTPPITTIQDLEGDPPCNPPAGFNNVISSAPNIEAEYSCQLIDMTPTSARFDIAQGQSDQTKLQAVDDSNNQIDFTRVRVSWHQPDQDNAFATRRGSQLLPQEEDWNSGGTPFPAMLRLHFFHHPDSGITHGALQSSARVMFADPEGSFTPDSSFEASYGDNGQIVNADCNDAARGDDYACVLDVDVSGAPGSAGNELYLRIQAVYAGAHVKVELLDAAGNILSLSGSQAAVDVTGKAGDVYRRVETRIELSPGFNPNLLPDFTILTVDDICKDFEVTNDDDDFIDRCTNSVPPPPPGPLAAGCTAPGYYTFIWDDGDLDTPIPPYGLFDVDRSSIGELNQTYIPAVSVRTYTGQTAIPPGIYTVRITTWDDHGPGDATQPNEIATIMLKDSNNNDLNDASPSTVVVIGPTSDIPDADKTITTTFNDVRVTRNATHLVRKHGSIEAYPGTGSFNSHSPARAEFTCTNGL